MFTVSEERDAGAGILMRERRGKSRGPFAKVGGGLFHRGWVQGEAEVLACSTSVSRRYVPTRPFGAIGVLPYVVTFQYVVNGNRYEGVLNSPDEVEKGDTFAIRYDPSHPENNNTFDSETNWTYTYTKIFSIVMILLMAILFIHSYFVRT
jgi:hypothetical protein